MNNDRKSRGLSGATIISFVVILVVVLWMANQLQMHQQEMTYTSFVSAVQEKNVSDVYINQNSAVPTGTVSVTLKDDGNTRKANPKRISNRIRYYLFERGLLSWDLNRPQTS